MDWRPPKSVSGLCTLQKIQRVLSVVKYGSLRGWEKCLIWPRWRSGDLERERERERERVVTNSVSGGSATKILWVGWLAAVDLLKKTNASFNNGRGPTREQCINATEAFLEKEGVDKKLEEKWFTAAANVTLTDGSKKVCRLKQTCTPTSAARKYITVITDVFLLNYAVGLDVARAGTQINTQGVWPCKSPLDSLPLQQLAKSLDLMSDLRKMTRRHILVG